MLKREFEQLSVNVSKKDIERMDALIERNKFSSRSSIIRRAVTEFLDQEEPRKILA